MSESTGSTKQYDVTELPIYDFFKYNPSLALACIALALFTLAALIIAVMTERRKAHRFMHTISITGLLEAGGYAALVYAIERSGKGNIFNAYVIMQVLVVLSPNLIQATMYWEVGKVLALSPELTKGRLLLRGWVITTMFAIADLFAIVIQAVGISIWASSQSSGDPDQDKIRLGCGITLAGLACQLVSFVCFTVLAIWTHRHPKNGLAGKRETRRLFFGLYVGMVFLYIRNIFRFAEFTQSTVLTWPPPDGTYVLSEQQVLFYTLDTLPILLCFATYILFHPGYLLPVLGTKQHQVADVEAAADNRQAADDDAAAAPSKGDGLEDGSTGFQLKVIEEHAP